MHYLYIARCKDNSLYIGITSNPEKRIKRHNRGSGSRWVKQHGTAELVYTEDFDTYLSARRRELQIKKWSRVKKERLVKGLSPSKL
jgi:putative endonuclease